MNEDIQKIEEQDQAQEEIQEQQKQSQHDPEIIQKAKSHGHIGYDEWVQSGRDPEKWKSEKDFVEFGDSYTKLKPHLDMLKQEISKRDSALEAMVNHINEVRQKEYLRGKLEVEEKLKEAREMGDIQAVEKLSQDKMQLEYQRQQEEQKRALEEQRRLDAEFTERNKHWYNQQHPELMQEMNNEVAKQRQMFPSASLGEVVARAESEMKFRHYDIINPGIRRDPISAPSRSNVTKTEYQAQETDTRAIKNLNNRDRDEYEYVRSMLKKSGIDYSVKEFLNQKSDYESKRGDE